jgi:hypothetical protein
MLSRKFQKGIGRMGRHSHSALAVGLLTYAACMGSAAAQTPPPWHAYNRYIELSAGQHQQNYREQDTGGLTADGTLDAETGSQSHIAVALGWQSASSSLVHVQAVRQSGVIPCHGNPAKYALWLTGVGRPNVADAKSSTKDKLFAV